ncbi:MAG TPA: bifunctional hydroxymethylpyrimidine kinase/phosphomethylpyrimidine kinase [Thermomicrobiaceae bacterium]|nr:bifunctional hydroxymethylpyrimidine kinase/phosphomethylpyrimidine kinase [Thermomicrobiaceae bacterium]
MTNAPGVRARALTIAGSDSGAGAGIQADLKTFAALGVYGSSAITAVTVQNTLGVNGYQEMSPEIVAGQIDAVMEDIGAQAVKTGMLASAAIVEAVSERSRHWRMDRLVVDPVMVAKGGDRLLREDAVEAIQRSLLPLAFVVTPNIPEAEVLSGRSIESEADMEEAARAIAALGPRYVVVKGGHREDEPIDVVFDGSKIHRLSSPRVETTNTHGTGCTFSAAISAGLAIGHEPLTAIARAKAFLYHALEESYAIGGGHSPVNHFYALWRCLEEPEPIRSMRKES